MQNSKWDVREIPFSFISSKADCLPDEEEKGVDGKTG
jgi:hypothetical protein